MEKNEKLSGNIPGQEITRQTGEEAPQAETASKAKEDAALAIKEKAPEKRKPRKRNSRIKKMLPLLLLILAAGGGIFFWNQHQGKARAASAGGGQIRTATVGRGTLVSELSSAGTISPKDTYTITSLVEGEVVLADFEEGDQVTEGQVLYQIDVSSMESELQSAANSLERANNSYQQALEDYEEALADYSGNTYKSNRTGFIRELKIEAGDKVGNNTELAEIYDDQVMKLKVPFLTGEAQLIGVGNQAVLTLADTEEQLAGVVTVVSNMDEVLVGGRIVRYVTIETANPGGLTASHTATATVGEFVCSREGSFEPVRDTVMRAELSGNVEVEALLVHEGDYVTNGTPVFRIRSKDAEDILQNYKDSVDTAQERVESARSKMDSTQKDYENYTITAPISGQVITKSVKAGDNVSRSSSSGASTMAVIYDLSQLTYEMSVDELDVRSVQVGQRVEVTADAVEGKTFAGTVTNISLESSQSNGVTNYPVTVTMEDAGELLPGMNVDGVIILEEAKDVLMIPVDALMRGNRVYVQDASVTEEQGNVPAGFRTAEVETGLSNDSYVQIVSGLSEGDVVYLDQASQSSTSVFPMGGIPGGGIPGGGPGGNGGGPGGNRGNGGGSGGGSGGNRGTGGGSGGSRGGNR